MRIISKFKDYYDGVMPSTREDPVVYVRKTKELKPSALDKTTRAFLHSMPSGPNDSAFRPAKTIVGFCGILYGFYSLENNLTVDTDYLFRAWSESVEARIVRSFRKAGRNRIQKAQNAKAMWGPQRYNFSPAGIANWIAENQCKEHHDIFMKLNAPVFILRLKDQWIIDYCVEVNPCLKDWGFQSTVNPWEAYQELDMYLGNNLCNQEDPEANVTDELKAHYHGYDKWSFRKMPSVKSRKKK